MIETIAPRSGVSFVLPKGHYLKITDPKGEQVSDLLTYSLHDRSEVISSGRTLDYASKIYLSTGDLFYSNRSNVMFEIVEDTVGRHDFLLTPCSKDTFRILYGHEHPHRGCFGNFCEALQKYGISPDAIPVAFNVFMNVEVNGETGVLSVKPPKSQAGDYVILKAHMDLIVAMTACSAEQSNNYSFKPIDYEVLEPSTFTRKSPAYEYESASV